MGFEEKAERRVRVQGRYQISAGIVCAGEPGCGSGDAVNAAVLGMNTLVAVRMTGK